MPDEPAAANNNRQPETPGDAGVLSEEQLLDRWWETLSEEQQASVLDIGDEEIPGWMIASLAAHNVRFGDASEDLKFRVPQALAEFVERVRSPDD